MSERIIVVDVKNDFLGDGEFWRGPASRIGEIRNIAARRAAAQVVVDGQARRCGMWHVRLEQAPQSTGADSEALGDAQGIAGHA